MLTPQAPTWNNQDHIPIQDGQIADPPQGGVVNGLAAGTATGAEHPLATGLQPNQELTSPHPALAGTVLQFCYTIARPAPEPGQRLLVEHHLAPLVHDKGQGTRLFDGVQAPRTSTKNLI